MLRTVKGQSLALLSWKTFVSVSLYFPAIQRHPPTGLSLGSSQTPRLINGSWRCPVISSPNNKLQPKTGVPLRPTFNTALLTTRRKPIIPCLLSSLRQCTFQRLWEVTELALSVAGETELRENLHHSYPGIIKDRRKKVRGNVIFAMGKQCLLQQILTPTWP